MAILLTDNAKAKAQTALGTEPLLILKINWSSGAKWYSEKPYTFDGNVCEDTIVVKGNLQSQGKEGSIGEISSLDISLDDTDGDLKTKVNTLVIEGTSAIAYHHYDDLPASDAAVVLSGKITGPINWLEGERILDFNIESYSGTGAGEVGFSPAEDTIENLLESAEDIPWPICFGSPRLIPAKLVQQIERTDFELDRDPEALPHSLIYIVNLFPSDSISGVYAQRNCYGVEGYYQVPSSLYTEELDYSYGGKNVTAIRMSQPLSTVDDSGWSDSILVSLTSTLSLNTAEQIKWILDTYSSLSTDAASFASVASKISNLPSHWALFHQPDALSLAEEMAWQARCALYEKNGIVYIKYLAEFTGTDSEITKNDAKLKSLELSFTKTEDIITKFKAQYVSDYSGDKEADKEYIYTRNTTQFGVETEDYTFDIYTNPECVKVAAQFWGYRYSTSWRQIKITTFLTALANEAYDWININLPIFSTYTLPSRVIVADHDVENHEITFELEVASSASTHIGGQPSLDTGYYASASVSGVGIPDSSIVLYTSCIPLLEEELKTSITEDDDIKNYINIRAISGGVPLKYDAVEIINMDQDGYIHVQTPSADNLPPDKILFVVRQDVGSYGYGLSAAGEPQWVDQRDDGSDPNWGNRTIKVGDSVGTVKDSRSLSKAMSGFLVVGIDNEIAVVNSEIKAPLVLKSDTYIPAFSILEVTAVTEGSVAYVVQQPSENNIPPGRLIVNITPIVAGEAGVGYSAFDISPFLDGDSDPENPNCEMGTKAGSFGLHYQDDDGNPLTGFIRIVGEGGKHQVRPF
jgi:hypothetical protein